MQKMGKTEFEKINKHSSWGEFRPWFMEILPLVRFSRKFSPGPIFGKSYPCPEPTQVFPLTRTHVSFTPSQR